MLDQVKCYKLRPVCCSLYKTLRPDLMPKQIPVLCMASVSDVPDRALMANVAQARERVEEMGENTSEETAANQCLQWKRNVPVHIIYFFKKITYLNNTAF